MTNPRAFTRGYLASALYLVIALPSQAGVIFSNFDDAPGTSFVQGSSYLIAGTGFGLSTSKLAYNFTPGSDYNVTQIDMVVSAAQNGTGAKALAVGIFSDLNSLPDSLLGSLYSFNANPLVNNTPVAQVATINSVSGVTLHGGTKYWLVIEAAATNTYADWYLVPSAVTPGAMCCNANGNFTSFSDKQGYFDVIGDLSTPEPGTLGLVAGGIFSLVLFWKRASLARR